MAPPRIEPLPESAWGAEERELLEKTAIGGRVYNIFGTLAHHPALLKRWTLFGNHVLFRNTLPAREREIVILRIGWLCGSEYEWGQHVLIGRRSDLSEEDFARIARGPEASGWSAREQLLLRATDELYRDARIGDATWQALAGMLDRKQLLDLVFTAGQYNLVSMALNTFGVERDPGVPGFDEVPGFRPARTPRA